MLNCSDALTFQKIGSQINYITRLKEFITSLLKITALEAIFLVSCHNYKLINTLRDIFKWYETR